MKDQVKTFMDGSSWSVFVWSLYLLTTGFLLLAVPEEYMHVMKLEVSRDLWVSMAALLTIVLGMYYLLVAWYRIYVLYYFKIAGHLLGVVIMVALYLNRHPVIPLLLTAAVDFVAALWTGIALLLEWRHGLHRFTASLHDMEHMPLPRTLTQDQ